MESISRKGMIKLFDVASLIFDVVNFESAKLKLARIWWSHGFSTLVVGWFHETKVAVLLDFVQMKGGRARALPKFFCHLFISAFLANKRSLFPQNANNLNFKVFFRLYTWPTKQEFCLYFRRILDKRYFGCHLNRRFWCSEKLYKLSK